MGRTGARRRCAGRLRRDTCGGATHAGFGLDLSGAVGRCLSLGLRSGGCGLLLRCTSALRLKARRFGALRFGTFGGSRFGCGLRHRVGRRLLCRDLGRSGCDVGCLSAAAYLAGVAALDGNRCRRDLGSNGRRGRSAAPTTRRRGRSRLSLGANALLALPPGSHARDLVVRQRAQMTTHGNVHLTKQSHHFVGGDPELASHVVYAKLAQTTLLWGSVGARLHELANPFRELPIYDANHCCRFAADHAAQLGGTRYFYESNPPGIQKRDHLIEAVPRRVHRDDGVGDFVLLRLLPYLLHPDNRSTATHTEADEPEQPAAGLG